MASGKHALLDALGKRICALRKQKGWTQTDMAVCLDIGRSHLSEIENGKREAGVVMLQIISKGLDVTMSKLLKDL